jgi:hypothetical protein
MSSKGMTKSAASARVKSSITAQKISPEGANSVGILLSREEAILLARNLLVLACSEEIQGDIVITGHPDQGRVTVLGYKTWQRNASARQPAVAQG